MGNSWNHPQFIRVYRPSRDQRHDLHTVLNMEDVYGAWKRGTLMESDAEVIEGFEAGGIAMRPAQLVVDYDIDIDVGYYIEVVRPMALDGSWTQVATTLDGAIIGGATSLTVVRGTGFRTGDQILLKDDNHSELTKVKSVAGTALTLYSDVAPHNGYDDGAVVRVSEFYRVITARQPHSLANHKAFDLQESMKVEAT